MSTRATPTGSQSGLSYFESWAQRAKRETSQTTPTDESGVSPGTTPPHRGQSNRKAGRPSFQYRSSSTHPETQSKIKIFPISESYSGRIHPIQRTRHVSHADYPYRGIDVRRPGDDPVVYFGAANTSSEPSAPSSVASPAPNTERKEPDSRASEQSSDGVIRKRSRSSIHWRRTHSGGVWFARTRPEARRELQKSPESERFASPFFGQSPGVPLPAPKPLRPPLARASYSAQSHRHNVKLEKAFTEAVEPPPQSSTPPARQSSLKARILLAYTISFARKMSLRSKVDGRAAVRPSEHASRSPKTPSDLLNHSSALRRNHTGDILRRVSSMLNDPLAQSPSWALPEMSKLSPRAIESGVHRAMTFDIKTAAMPATDSWTPEASVTSSINEIRMGAVPTSTPDQSATYRVKKSKSAETQVFFKVDISIRGGTSYLPSEARRIHTPPLPIEDMQGKRRGFFFDYNAPRDHEEPSADLGGEVREQQHATISQHDRRRPLKRTTRASTGRNPSGRDWFEVRLAQLDHDTEEVGDEKGDVCMAREGTEHGYEDTKRPAAQVEIDYNIPEHLPSSPLCPKHERYWRLEQNKLKPSEKKQRVCWMHGPRNEKFGEKFVL